MDKHDNDMAVELIERSERDTPWCSTCGAPTITVAHGDSIWLECSTLQAARPFLRRLIALDPLFGHTRQAIITDLAA
jgi:hypothetical protein